MSDINDFSEDTNVSASSWSIGQQAELERWRRGRADVRRRLSGAAMGAFVYLISALAVGAFLIVAVAAVTRDTTVMDGWDSLGVDLSWMYKIVWGYGALALLATVVFPLVLLMVAGRLPPLLARVMRSLPGIGSTMRMVELGDFCQSMYMSIAQSKTYGQAFGDAVQDVRDADMRRWAKSSAASVEGGQPLASVLRFAPIREQPLPAILAFVQGGVSQTEALRIWHHAAEDCHQQAQARLQRTVQAMSVTFLLAAVFLATLGLLLAATITIMVLQGWVSMLYSLSAYIMMKSMGGFGGSQLFVLAASVVLMLVAGALHLIAAGTLGHAVTRQGRMLVTLLRVVEALLWIFSFLALVIALPHPTTIVLCVMILASIFIARSWRYRGEVESLNKWLRVAAETSVSTPLLVDVMADGFRGRLAGQSREFAARMNRGESIENAVRRSRLPVQADTLAAILQAREAALREPSGAQTDDLNVGNAVPTRGVFRSRDALSHHNDMSTSPVLVSEQFVYVILLVFLAWVIGRAVRAIILPEFSRMLEEFFSDSSRATMGLDTTVMLGNVVVTILVIWLLAAALIPLLPVWMVRYVPWFGRFAVDRWRCEVLQTVAYGVRSHLPAADILQHAPATTRVSWIQKRCQQAVQSIDQGTGLAGSLHRATLVSENEQAWLSTAEKNGSLADTIEQIVRNIRRRQILLWQVRKAWLVPLATVCVGLYVLVHAVVIFRFLTMLMGVG